MPPVLYMLPVWYMLTSNIPLLSYFKLLRIMDFFNANSRVVKPYDRGELLSKLPFEMRSKIVSHLYLPTIKVQFF